MANVDNPRGFVNPRPKAGHSGRIETLKSDGVGTIAKGDPVTFVASGRYARAITSETISHVAQEYVAATADLPFKALPVEDYTFEIQVDDNSITTDASVGAAFDLIADAAGDATLGTSNLELDGDASTNDDMTVVGLVDRPDNDNSLTNNAVRVTIP